MVKGSAAIRLLAAILSFVLLAICMHYYYLGIAAIALEAYATTPRNTVSTRLKPLLAVTGLLAISVFAIGLGRPMDPIYVIVGAYIFLIPGASLVLYGFDIGFPMLSKLDQRIYSVLTLLPMVTTKYLAAAVCSREFAAASLVFFGSSLMIEYIMLTTSRPEAIHTGLLRGASIPTVYIALLGLLIGLIAGVIPGVYIAKVGRKLPKLAECIAYVDRKLFTAATISLTALVLLSTMLTIRSPYAALLTASFALWLYALTINPFALSAIRQALASILYTIRRGITKVARYGRIKRG